VDLAAYAESLGVRCCARRRSASCGRR